MPESQGYVFYCLHRKRGIALIGVKNIKTGLNINVWSHVLFTDESRFSLTSDSKRVYIWRESGTRNDPSNIVERDRFGSGGVMVWGGIMIDGRTPLHVFRSGSVTGQIYRDEVLDPYVRLFRGAYGRDFLFMDDNARPHRANLVDEFLESEDIKRIPWPANSPDLNPIENLWDYLGRAIARRHPPPRDVNGLKTALLEEWSLIPQTVINNVISSLKTRCDMCVRVREIIFHIKFSRLLLFVRRKLQLKGWSGKNTLDELRDGRDNVPWGGHKFTTRKYVPP
ncbi:transposable element Tc3 transposase [Trichonephila clavipes]|nr:transposable element Tc3 transposase [Trichonephila clavipes]